LSRYQSYFLGHGK